MTDHPQPAEELRAAITSQDAEAADLCIEELASADSVRAVLRLSDNDQSQLMTMLPNDHAASLLEELPESEAANLVSHLTADQAADILNEVNSDEQADILSRLSAADAEAILREMEPEEADDARRLMQYAGDVAGGLMISEYLSYVESSCVEDVLSDLRNHAADYARYQVQYAYVTAQDGPLVGVLRLRDLLLSKPGTSVSDLMIRDPESVNLLTPLRDLEQFFDRHPYFGVPVTDANGTLVGVVRQNAVLEASEELASQTLLKLTGILGGEELRTMPVRLRSFRRLSWLSINIVLNIAAASVIAMYQETLEAVIALAVFLPIISDMSGCSGNQAVAVSMRELSLGLVKPSEAFRVLWKEASVGIINGVTLGLLLGVIAFLWKGQIALGIVVATALAANTIIAVCIGGCVPLLLSGLKQDPALASGPILTTITDMCGFLLVLSLATAMLQWLV
ncbi:magnesium transporter [Planctomycetes bacterium K23_9]|uniref:Magnesium transporter MgtE n=1 Tax=Stieleria marina TaxID=1930275 RepID=A0A517P1E5_9BACT|nr:Magnesium transporter MgtE [Planctomycetes bacterium K23_9]